MTCDQENTVPKKEATGTKRSSDSGVNPAGVSEEKKARTKPEIEVTLAPSELGQLSQIESEFRILKSLIPNIADRSQINELEIIDACVNYIENLQNQLGANRSKQTNNNNNNESEPEDSTVVKEKT